MLSLFQNHEESICSSKGLERAKELLMSSLNKGSVPTWEFFFQELPALNLDSDLEEIKKYFTSLTSWDFLEEILQRDGTEFFFHGPDNSQVLKSDGRKEYIQIPIASCDWQLWLEILSIHFKQNWNVETPFASFHGELFNHNYRFSLIHGSTSPTGDSKLILRCLASAPHPLASFGQADALVDFVKDKKNILIAGSTGSGKTSLLTSLIKFIDPDEHLVILEDTYEILSPHPHQTRFLAGRTQETGLKAYLAYSLRLSPDRIILGEMRSHEVVPYLMAMNTGHKGLMGTIHASSAVDALHRVALLFSLYSSEVNLSFEKVMELICRNMEYCVFMENKRVKEVIKILGCEKGVPFYENIKAAPSEGASLEDGSFNLF